MSNLQFTEPKAIRLAFHDCIPYKNPNGGSPTGGCDGCINFDEDVVENNVLQPSVALLVSSHLDLNIEHSFTFSFIIKHIVSIDLDVTCSILGKIVSGEGFCQRRTW